MSHLEHGRVMEVLAGAMELPPARRTSYLDSTCHGQPELRREVEDLLECANPAAEAFDAASEQLVRADPEQIGPYAILEPVGEGGMAVVYKARQHHPVRRIVALKLIKLGMDTRQFVARFEAERQALAVMDHPSIARVYDAGATDTGRPYFVMEYVEGRSILGYCDARGLDIRQRLDLFATVCDAVEHGHRRGIIHRDLKDSNVLIAEVDGRPVPKVIDFGVAKAIQQPLTDRTLHTEHGQLIGTPEYMSPEQAERGAADVDTRADVYSLGVLLYELIAGVHPIPSDVLRGAGYEQVQRIVRDTEPPRPSTRLSTLGGADATRIAQRRRTALPTLIRELRSELEWVPLKAMRKDREQRYRSASELADDVRNYLDGRPLIAGPESRAYRARKFLRRHKAGVAASAAIFLLLVGGIIATGWQAVRATRAEHRAVNQQQRADREADAARKQAAIASSVNDLMTNMIGKANRSQQKGDPDVTVRAVMDTVAAELNAGTVRYEPEVEAALREAIGRAYDALGLYDAAEPMLREALEQRVRLAGIRSIEAAETQSVLALLMNHKGDDAAAEALYRQALATVRELRGVEHPEVANALSNLAGLLSDKGDYDAAEPLMREALTMRRKLFGSEHPDVAISLNNLGNLLLRKADVAAAEPMLREALAMQRKLLGTESPEVAYTLNNLASVLQRKGDYAAAEPLFRESLTMRRKLFGDAHRDVAIAIENLAEVLRRQGDYATAESLAREALAMRIKLLGAEHPDIASSLNLLANLLADQGDYDGAERHLRDGLAIRRKLLGNDHEKVAQSVNNLATILVDKRNFAAAEPLFREALERGRRSVGDNHPDVLATIRNLGLCLAAQGRLAEAEALLRELHERIPLAQLPAQDAALHASFYGLCLAKLGRYEQAEQPLRQAYERLTSAGLEKHPQTAGVVGALAKVCEHTNRPDEAAEWRDKLKDLQAATRPATSPATQSTTRP